MDLRFGDAGAAVSALQTRLVAMGFPLVIDGVFGARTDDAVRGVQLVAKLPVDGVVGPATASFLTGGDWEDIRSEYCGAALITMEHTETLTSVIATTTCAADVRYPSVISDRYPQQPVANIELRAAAVRAMRDLLDKQAPVVDPFGPNFITGEVEATLLSATLFAAQGVLSRYVSGAPGPTSAVVTNIVDLARGRSLTTDALFMPGTAWRPVVRQLALAAFPAASAIGVAATSANYQLLTLTPLGIRVTFRAGQILPLSAGAPSFVADWAALAQVVRPSIVARARMGLAGGPGPHVP